MIVPRPAGVVGRRIRAAVAGALLTAALVGCTSTPAALDQSSTSAVSVASSSDAAITSSMGADSGPTAAPSATDSATVGTDSTESDSTAAPSADGSTSATNSSAGSVPAQGSSTSDTRGASGDATPTSTTTGVVSPATTIEVPAPGGGDVNQTVATSAVTTGTTAPLTGSAIFGASDVSARVLKVAAITATAVGPGESSGPALSVTVEITNRGGAAILLDGTSVELQSSTGAPGLAMSGSPYRPVQGSLAPGKSATGVYVFAVPISDRSPVTISVRYSTEAPVVLFVGDAK